GYYSLLAATANSSLIIHAFEPASGPSLFLRKNTEINGLNKRITCHEIALSNEKGEVEFFEITNPSGTFARYNLSGVGGLKKTHETQEQSIRKTVRAERLDEYIKTLNLSSIDLVKVDTEGTENMVLEGMSSIIQRDKPIIICETLFNNIEAKLEEIMKLHGYLFYNHLDGKLFPVDTIIRRTDNGVSDCFFVHPDKEHLMAPFIFSDHP
ncbi:MAG: FkbM family methyltransferase, partial [Bacteroidota bacterium]|nr:FkbM family methyltransferase [Bacteroidota bacterium]